MKKHLGKISVIALTTLLGIGGMVLANPDWGAGSPSQAPGNGGIMLQGTFTPDAPYQTTGGARVNYWPVGGGQKMVAPEVVQPGQTGLVTWGPYGIGGLTTGQQYNFSVEIDVIDPSTMATATYLTDTKQQTVP